MQQLVDIEPSPVSAMRMTLAQVVLTVVSIPILIPDTNHGSSTPFMSLYLSVLVTFMYYPTKPFNNAVHLVTPGAMIEILHDTVNL